MSRHIDHLVDEIERVMTRFRFEYDLTYAELVGVLELIKADVIFEAMEEEPE